MYVFRFQLIFLIYTITVNNIYGFIGRNTAENSAIIWIK